MSTENLERKIKELHELQRMAEEITAEMESIKDEIKAAMTAQNTDTITAGEYRVRWTAVTSRRFDTTAFKKVYSDLYNQFTKESVTRRFSIA